MKISIVTFSQTGNTRKVAKAISEGLEEAGEKVDSVSLKKATVSAVEGCDVVGIGTPCFSSRAPQPVLDFIEALPSLDGRRAFVFSTSGGGPGMVLYEMTHALRRKKADVAGGIIIRGECFHPFPAILGRFPGRPNAEDLANARDFAMNVKNHVNSGAPGPMPGARRDSIKRGNSFYEVVGRLNTDEQLRQTLKKPVVDTSKCDQCMWCAKECPTKSITIDPYPELGETCIRCYRCVSGCPLDAYVADMRLGNFLAYIFYNTFFERYLGDVKKGEKFY